MKGSILVVDRRDFWDRYPFSAFKRPDSDDSLFDRKRSFPQGLASLVDDPAQYKIVISDYRDANDVDVSAAILPKINAAARQAGIPHILCTNWNASYLPEFHRVIDEIIEQDWLGQQAVPNIIVSSADHRNLAGVIRSINSDPAGYLVSQVQEYRGVKLVNIRPQPVYPNHITPSGSVYTGLINSTYKTRQDTSKDNRI